MRNGQTFLDEASQTMTTVAPTEGVAHVTVTDRKAHLAVFSVLSAAQARAVAEELHHIADDLDADAAVAKAKAEAEDREKRTTTNEGSTVILPPAS